MNTANALSQVQFEGVPASIDFFISHPFVSSLLTSRISLPLVTVLTTGLLFFALSAIVKKKSIVINLIFILLLCVFMISFRAAATKAAFALHPSSATIIAAIIEDKAIVRSFIFAKYYLTTKIGTKVFGVVTNAQTYNNPRYSAGATFDYSLYTYIEGDTITLYRFLKPEFKLTPEAGNLQ